MFWLDVDLNYLLKSHFISICSVTWRSHREWAFTAWWNVWSTVSSRSGRLGPSAHRLVAMEVCGPLCMFILNNLVLSIFPCTVAWQTGIRHAGQLEATWRGRQWLSTHTEGREKLASSQVLTIRRRLKNCLWTVAHTRGAAGHVWQCLFKRS